MARSLSLLSTVLLLAACGGSQPERTLPDESADLEVGASSSGFSAAGTTPVGPDIGGTQWRFVEAHCTEGPLDLSDRGFEQTLRVESDAEGLLLTYDQTFEQEDCVQTVVQRARPSEGSREWTIAEETRVALPANEACFGEMEEQRQGEVRRSGEFLEVIVYRSFVWCNGYDVRMVYAPEASEPVPGPALVRHYVAHFNRRDPQRVAGLFAEGGSLVEPFRVNPTGGPTRHDGRAAILAWYQETLSGVDWLTLRLTGVESQPDDENQFRADWHYMDPRLEEPMEGRNHFTVAAGQIYESRFELTDPPPGSGFAGAGAEEEASEEDEESGEDATEGDVERSEATDQGAP